MVSLIGVVCDFKQMKTPRSIELVIGLGNLSAVKIAIWESSLKRVYPPTHSSEALGRRGKKNLRIYE